MDYIVKISGDFKKGECGKCPASYRLKGYCNGEAIVWGKSCLFACKPENCPLEEVKQGEWERYREENCVICSECGAEHYLGTMHQFSSNFCPNCGAEMKGGK